MYGHTVFEKDVWFYMRIINAVWNLYHQIESCLSYMMMYWKYEELFIYILYDLNFSGIF